MPTTATALATLVDPAAGLRVDATLGSGFEVRYDTAEAGDARAGPSPTETLLGALAACAAMDVASILRKKRQRVLGYQIAVTAERADEHPRVFTSITIEHRVSGDVEPEALRRSVELSALAYCPVNAMLSAAVRVEHRYALRRGGELPEAAALVTVTGPRRSPVS